MIELGCTACRQDVHLPYHLRRHELLESVNDYVLLIVHHYREHHPAIMDTFMHDYTRFLFAKAGLVLPE